jgi:glycosyltransferase involved in cell wall biosynthesis
MSIKDDDFVILVCGSLRSWNEIELIKRAFDLAKIPKKRLLMAGKIATADRSWRARSRRLGWNFWLNRRGAIVDRRFIPEEELSGWFDSSDVTIVPRLAGLNSAMPLYAMTFGLAVIAPSHGVYPEYIAGTRNLLYDSGNAESLARKLEEAATLDLKEIGRESATVASTWKWQNICRACLAAAGIEPAC